MTFAEIQSSGGQFWGRLADVLRANPRSCGVLGSYWVGPTSTIFSFKESKNGRNP